MKNLLSRRWHWNRAARTACITNLAVTSANLLSAMLGKLVLRGEDGKYYQVMIGADGTIHTQEVQPRKRKSKLGRRKAAWALWTPVPTLRT